MIWGPGPALAAWAVKPRMSGKYRRIESEGKSWLVKGQKAPCLGNRGLLRSDCLGFEITTTAHFAAAHRLRLENGSWESLHGHNWMAKITVSATKLDAIGLVMDFHELTRLVDGVILPMRNVN